MTTYCCFGSLCDPDFLFPGVSTSWSGVCGVQMQILLLSRRLLLLRDDPLLQQMPRRCGKTKTHNKTCQVSSWPDLDIVGQWTVSVEDGSPTYWRGVCSRMCNLQKYTILLMSGNIYYTYTSW